MHLGDILNVIGSYAFPIVACVAIFLKSGEDAKAYREEIRQMTEAHKQEQEKLVKAVNNNTLAVTRLIDLLRKDGADDAAGD